MASLGSIYVDLILRDAGYTDAFKKAAKTTSDFEKGVKSLLVQMAPLLGGASFVAIAHSALEAADSIDKLAAKLGLTTDEIQKYQYAAKIAGVSNEQLLTSFAYLNRQIAEGKVPYKNLQDAIQGIAEKTENSQNGVQRARLAFEAFGKSGVNLIPFLQQGKKGLQELGDEAERLGAVIPADVIENATRFKDQLEILGTVIKNNFQAGLLEEFVGSSENIRKIYTDPTFIQGIKDIGKAFGVILDVMVNLVTYYEKSANVLGTFGAKVLSKMEYTDENGKRQKYIDPDVAAELDGAAADRLKGSLPPLPKLNTRLPGEGTDPGSFLPEKESRLKEYIETLNKETDAIGLSQKALAVQRDLIQANAAARADYQNGLRKTPDLSEQERAAIERAAGQYYDLAQAQRQAEQLNEDFKNSFEDFATSVFDGSKKMGDALRDLVKSFAELALKQQVLQPLADSIFGARGSAGSSGGGFGNLFASASSYISRLLPSFDTGIDNVPYDMVAQIHKDERVLTASQNQALKNGNFGNTINNIDARGTDASVVRRLEAMLIARTSQRAIISQVSDAETRGAV